MYRISHHNGIARAVGVCHDCKTEAPSHIWAEQGDGYQTVPPSGWTTFVQGRMQRLRCGSCRDEVAAAQRAHEAMLTKESATPPSPPLPPPQGGPLLCRGCGRTIAQHDAMLHCYPPSPTPPPNTQRVNTCVVSGLPVTDVDACGDCDPCLFGQPSPAPVQPADRSSEPFLHVINGNEIWLSRLDANGTFEPIAGPVPVPLEFRAALASTQRKEGA
jgi:hypothetical protein